MAQYLTGSAGSVTVRRIMENIMVTLPVGAILFLPIAFGLKHMYPWTDPDMVRPSAVLKPRSQLSDENFFVLRTYIYFLLWSIWIFAIYHQSTKQDTRTLHSADERDRAVERAGLVPGGRGGNAGRV